MESETNSGADDDTPFPTSTMDPLVSSAKTELPIQKLVSPTNNALQLMIFASIDLLTALIAAKVIRQL